MTTTKGNGGVAETVARTPGAIGYVDYNYVVRHQLDPVLLRNRTGAFVAPDTESFAAALAASPWPRTGDFSTTLTDQPGAKTWPITMGTFILVPRRGGDAMGVQQAVEFFTWAFLHGDDLVATSQFVRLPESVPVKAFRALASITDAAGKLRRLHRTGALTLPGRCRRRKLREGACINLFSREWYSLAGKRPMNIKVECYAGYRGEEEPRAFHIGQRRVEVSAIVDRWLDPHHRYFKVQGDDGAIYILRHDEDSGAWDMKWFGAGG